MLDRRRNFPAAGPPSLLAGPSRFRRARRRTRILLSLALLAVVTGGVAAVVALAAPEPPAVVPYPAVTGDLGQH